MRVDVEIVRELKDTLLAINKEKLEDIEWYLDDKKLEIPQKDVDSFKFTGLNNTDFVTGAYSAIILKCP